jgi:hypothetical protein
VCYQILSVVWFSDLNAQEYNMARGYDLLFSMCNVALDLDDIIVSLFQRIGEYGATFIEFDYLPRVIILLSYQYKSNLV